MPTTWSRYWVFQLADGPCVSLEHWLCVSLEHWLEQNAGQCADTIETRHSFSVQMCAGLRELHGGGESVARTSSAVAAAASSMSTPKNKPWVHQDLKPDNMLLFCGDGSDTKEGRPVRLAITDFGLTVRCNSDRPLFCGTPRYMAPRPFPFCRYDTLHGRGNRRGPRRVTYGRRVS